jgi:hypothetical protein
MPTGSGTPDYDRGVCCNVAAEEAESIDAAGGELRDARGEEIGCDVSKRFGSVICK